MTIYMVSWCGLLDLDTVDIPLGAYRTEPEATDSVLNIGPFEYRDGIITVYRTWFPGRFIGGVPIKRWGYQTILGEDRVVLSECDL